METNENADLIEKSVVKGLEDEAIGNLQKEKN